jgi:hypothetical protein
MNISSKELFEKFYNEVAKDKYPQCSKQKIAACCYIPFKFLRLAFKSDNVPTISFKYLGSFYPLPNNAFKFIHHIYPKIVNKEKPDKCWTRKMYNLSKYIIVRKICELEEMFINERGLKTMVYN